MRCARRGTAALITFLMGASLVQCSDNRALVYKKKYIMGTVFEIAAYDQSSENATAAIEKAFQEIVRLDDLMSNYKPDSALSQLNRSAHFHAETVPPDLYRVVDQAMLYSRLSAGKFDISVGPLVNLWKAALRGEGMPSQARQQEVRRCVGYEKIELIPPGRINFHSSCMQLDLGGIGKGYAVDRAVEVLHSLGIHDALINAGGSTIFAMGSPPGQSGWFLHLRDPSNKIAPQVIIKDGSVSTSEQTAASLLGNDSAGHIIDPEAGRPLNVALAVSVVAKTATASDALSTTMLLVGPAKGKELIKSMADVSAIWISPDSQAETVMVGPQIQVGSGLSTAFRSGQTP